MIKEFIKKIGTGPHGVRDLTREEAEKAAGLLLSGTVTPAQAGALLLGLRLKGETGEEMGGFLDSLRAILPPRPSPSPFDLDIGDPYDGKTRSISLVVPAAINAARMGISIVLHGLPGVPVKQGLGVVDVWRSLGRTLSKPGERVAPEGKGAVCCLSQESFLPDLARLLPIRQQLGLRTLWNTVEKCVNPLDSGAQIIGIFHEPVIEKLRKAINKEKSLPPRRILFVCGSEGGVDLYTHRATHCHLLDPALGPDLKPVTIPPPEKPPSSLPFTGDGPELAKIFEEIAKDPAHPVACHLRRQTALFLFASGQCATFEEAEEQVADGRSIQGPVPFTPPSRSHP